jgi:DNA-binding beta-propeller fold protein YncE
MQLQLEKSVLSPIVWERTWKGAPKAADIYQNKLYVITSDAKLFKYTQSITGYTQEGNWLAPDLPSQLLAGTISMAIDGNVWVLKEGGEIIKLFKGKQAPFAYIITPPLQKPIKIFTDLDVAYLYLLDSKTRRVVILSKDGKLINQLTAEEFSSPSDMAVDEKNKKIYLLDGNKTFEIGF